MPSINVYNFKLARTFTPMDVSCVQVNSKQPQMSVDVCSVITIVDQHFQEFVLTLQRDPL